jgi:hypothetical protein
MEYPIATGVSAPYALDTFVMQGEILMVTFEEMIDSHTLSVPSGAYAKMSADQMARASRYGVQ